MVASLLTSLLLVSMTCHHVTHSVILRPKWFPYFRDGQGVPLPANHTGRGHSAEELRRLLDERRQHGQHPGSDNALSRLDLRRAANCTWPQSRPQTSETVAGCFFRYSSLLMRMMQQGFASSP